MIVGTAGHIDHGKTTLVRALTGVDTDRLPEERRRGISIELGYAYQPLADGTVLGYVDVPGHEKLVHTMLAGACGIDYALLVVAADDGVMPQTREHLAILELLGVAAGAVALTKIDRVAPARRAEVAAALRAELAAGALRSAPLFEVNATDPADGGVAQLRAELERAAGASAARASDGLFRLAIDRVFTLAGRGTVVAGTVAAGRLALGEPVTILPAGISSRARSIHAHNRPAAEARAGERCALNLAGVELEAVHRGDWLADPRALGVSARIDARLRLLPTAPQPLRSWAPLHLHWGAAHRLVHVVLLEHERLRPGDSGYVQFVFERPACGAPGERFIVRNPQASQTLGGGLLLDPLAPARRRRSPARLARLAALEALAGGAGPGALLEATPLGLSQAELLRLGGRPAAALPPGVRRVGAGQAPESQFLIRESAWDGLKTRALGALAEFHLSRPDEPGPDRARLQRIAAPGSPAPLWAAVIEGLIAAGSLTRSGAWLQLPAHRATLSVRDGALAARLAPLLAAGRYDPPWVRELVAASGEPEERVRQLLAALARDGRAFQVVPDLYYDRGALAELAAIVATLAAEHGEVEAARFRDAVGLGRKRAIQILEFFDRAGYTRRVGNAHRLRTDSGWLPSA